MDRRNLIKSAGSLAIFAGLSVRPVFARPIEGYPFTLGVASGDPLPDGVVLWTRLAPDPLIGGGMARANVDVRWEVATDESMRRVVKRGQAVA